MASIQQLPSGLWRARVRRLGQGTQSKSFALKLDAEAWARKLESAQERGVWRDNNEAERTTLRAALDRYEREVTPRKRAQDSERSNLRMLRAERIAGQALARIGSQDVAAMRDAWQRAGLKPASIKRRMVTLAHVFAVAAREWGLVELVNPVRTVRLEPENNARTRRVSEAEIDALCAATGSAALASFIRLAVETAMRRGELCALRWENVDLKARTAHLPHTKNGSARDVPLSSRAIAALRALPRRIDGQVFGLRPDSVTQAFERAAVRASIDNVRFHDLRHEATTRLSDKLPNLLELAAVTGHKDLRMLKRYYHPRAADLAKKLDAD
ncbi:MAG: tyrosine-type recombinase/integrase [Metallibacterium scheffleri]|uniref:Integrase n=1 Tax=Metallibacterium scheffleri TaxID=993689 RepID=A0A4S3KLP3_9GAMM|nr:site-specific integrase [Metallibacterium scheffleri]THD09318.1 hypothetical protein B1806_11340 [Metallibacterium scheffleri]